MADDTIPLYDGELSGAKIIPDGQVDDGMTRTMRSKRKGPRSNLDRVHVCFSPMLPTGQVEHVECPVFDISERGFAIEYDRKLDVGITGYISYRTISHQPVHVSCTVRRCHTLGNGHYELGVQLNRKLKFEERRPARVGPGRELAPGVRARKLRAPVRTGPESGARHLSERDPSQEPV